MPDDFKIMTEKYILKKMTKQEAFDFEQLLGGDEGLRARYEEHRTLLQGVRLLGRDQLKDRLKVIHGQAGSGEGAGKSRLGGYLLGALLLAILLAVLYFVFFQTEAPEKIYADVYQPYEWSTGSRNQVEDPALLDLKQLYSNQEYRALLPRIQEQLKINQSDGRLLLLAGICHLELGELVNARTNFSSITAKNDLRFADQANWYLALSYLREGAIADAKRHLSSLQADVNADKHQEAVELLKRLGE